MSERACAHHPDHPAIAICSTCGEDICAVCHRTTITGFAICTTCEGKIRAALQTEWESASGIGEHLSAFASTLVAVLFSGRQYFRQMPILGPWVKPAIFGTICYGLGALATFIWNFMYVPEFAEFVHGYGGELDLSKRGALLALLLAVPFAAPLAFAVHSFLLWIALRLFGTDAPWRLVPRITGYASAAYLFQLVPPIASFPIGYMLSIVWLVNIELVAVRRFFSDLGVWQSMGAVFLPFLALTLIGI